jgi:uncharacterized membrane protein YsdA (DUF1294 family)
MRLSRAFDRYLLWTAGPAVVLALALAFGLHFRLVLAWLLAINLAAFLAFAYDKRMAPVAAAAGRSGGQLRVPESVLLVLTALGGSLGAFLGMQLLRHKTAKHEFLIRFWLIAAVELVVAAVYLLISGASFLPALLP